jgi:hypothetical protein
MGPTCTRCFKFGVQCDEHLEKSASKPPLRPRRLTPKVYALISSAHSQIRHAPSRSLFRNEQEKHYFQIFCSQTAPHLGGLFEKSLWQTLVLQARETESPLRHTIIALGALNIASSPRRQKGPEPSTANSRFANTARLPQFRQKVPSGKVGERGSDRNCMPLSFRVYYSHVSRLSTAARMRLLRRSMLVFESSRSGNDSTPRTLTT